MNEIRIPQENANDDVVMITWLSEEKSVIKGDHIATFETSKSQVEFLSPFEGRLAFKCAVGSEVPVNSVLALVVDSDDVLDEPSESFSQISSTADRTLVTSHNAQALIDSGSGSQIDGSMPKWLVSDDLMPQSSRASNAGALRFTGDRFSISPVLPHEVRRSSIRKRSEIQSLSKAQAAGYVSCLGFSVRGQRKWCENFLFKEKISDLVCYESFHLLTNAFSDLNSCYLNGSEVAVFDKVICGFSFDNADAPGQLLVVPLDESAFSSVPSVQDGITSLANLFFSGNLSPEHFGETTFTVTDLSGAGPNFVFPLINGNQGLIISIASSDTGFNIFISFDHRVTEGLRMSQFGSELTDRIQRHLNLATVRSSACDYCGKSLAEEIEMGSRGLIKLSVPEGEYLICRVCFDGW